LRKDLSPLNRRARPHITQRRHTRRQHDRRAASTLLASDAPNGSAHAVGGVRYERRTQMSQRARRTARDRDRGRARAVATPQAVRPGFTWAGVADMWRRVRRALATVEGQRRLAWGLVILCAILDVSLVGQRAVYRHLAYHTGSFDLGNMDQAVWNSLHGHFFRFTNRGGDWYGPPTRLGMHVEPILVLIAPLYLIHPGATTLLVLQAVALGAGALPLLALSLRRLPNAPLLGVCFVVAYLLAPELLGEALYEFHPVALATPLLLVALYALERRRYGWFLLAGALAAACKEDVALALVPLGLLIAVRDRRRVLGWGVAVGAVAWTALCFLVIIPHFNDGTSVGGNTYWYRYAALGETPAAAVRHIVANPLLLVAVVATPDKIDYLALLLRTGGGLGIVAPFWWLVGVPELAINLLSARQQQISGFYQYNALLLPTLMAAAVYGTAALYEARLAVLSGRAPAPPADALHPVAGYLRRVRRRWMWRLGRLPIQPRLIAPLVGVWLLVAAGWNLAALSYKVGGFWQSGTAPTALDAQVDTLLRKIPPDATVAATDTLDPHLSDRYTIYLMPDPLSYQARYVAIDLPDVLEPDQTADAHMFASMIASGRYRVVGTAGSVVVLQRVDLPG
jgi:uncharacterized membrane protein